MYFYFSFSSFSTSTDSIYFISALFQGFHFLYFKVLWFIVKERKKGKDNNNKS